MTVLVVDNGSDHLAGIVDYLATRDTRVECKKFDRIERYDNFTAYILSGRIGGTHETDRMNVKIIKHAYDEKKTLIGICYGAEVLAMQFGCNLCNDYDKKYGIHQLRLLSESPLGVADIDVFYSNRYYICEMGDGIKVLGTSSKNIPELIQVQNSRMYGMLFHPEKNNPGRRLLDSVLDESNLPMRSGFRC